MTDATKAARAIVRLGEESAAWEKVAAYCDEPVLLRARAIANTARARAARLEEFVRSLGAEELAPDPEPIGGRR